MKEHPEKRQKYQKDYQQKHRERLQEYNRDHRNSIRKSIMEMSDEEFLVWAGFREPEAIHTVSEPDEEEMIS